MVQKERHPLHEMLDVPLEPSNDNDKKIGKEKKGEKREKKNTRTKKVYKKNQEPPQLPKEYLEATEEQERKEFHEEAHEEIARKNFFKKAKGEDTSDENKIAETREKINNLDLSGDEKESKLSEMKKMIKEKYDINLNAWANPEEEADAKKMNRLGDILKGKNPENMGFFKRLFIGISEKERMQAKSFKNDYDAYAELADEIAEAAEQPRRGKKKNQLPPIETPPKYQWI